MIIVLFILFLFFVIGTKNTYAQVINEVLPNPSGDENTDEWVEIYNPYDEEIDIDGYLLVDKAGHELLIDDRFAENGTKTGPKGFNVIGRNDSKFSLNNTDLEVIYLYKDQTKTELLDTFEYSKTNTDLSWGRVPDGGSISEYYLDPSPGIANNPPPTPTPTKVPTPTKTPKPISTKKPTDTPSPTLAPTKITLPTNNEKKLVSKTNTETINSRNDAKSGAVLGDSKKTEKEAEEIIIDEYSDNRKLPVTSLAFVLGGLSFLGAGSYPFVKKHFKNKKIKRSKIKKDEKIKL